MLFQMNNFWVKYLDDIRTTSDVSLTNTLFHKYYNNQFYFADKEAGLPFMIAPESVFAASLPLIGERRWCSFLGIFMCTTATSGFSGTITT